jgi:hypothetical protein
MKAASPRIRTVIRESMAGMVNMNEIQPPDPDKRQLIISESDDPTLERIRQHALDMMVSICRGKRIAPPEYAGWSDFAGEIKAEQQKRLG